MLQFDTSPDLLPVPDLAVVPTKGVLIILAFIYYFSQFLFLRTLRGSSYCTESVESEFARFRARLLYFWS